MSSQLLKITDQQAQTLLKAQADFRAVYNKAQKDVDEASKKLEDVYKGILKKIRDQTDP